MSPELLLNVKSKDTTLIYIVISRLRRRLPRTAGSSNYVSLEDYLVAFEMLGYLFRRKRAPMDPIDLRDFEN